MSTGTGITAESRGRGAAAQMGTLLRRVTTVIADPSARRGFFSVCDQAIVSATNFVTTVLVGRMCSQEQLGIYCLALSIVYFIRGIQETVLTSPYTIYCTRRTGRELAAYTGSLFAHQCVLSLLTACTLGGIGAAIHFGYGPAGLQATSWALIAIAPCILLREFIRRVMFAQLNVRAAIGIDTAVALLQIGTLAALAWCGRLTVMTAFATIGAACAAVSAAWFAIRVQPLRLVRHAVWQDWVHNWTFARWTLASQLVGSSTPYLMPWFVAVAQGEAETGVFGACTTLVGAANTFVIGMYNYLSPTAARAYAEHGLRALQRVLLSIGAIFVAALGTFCLIVFFLGDTILVFVFGPEFLGAGIVTFVLGLTMLIGSLEMTIGNGLCAMERPAANFVSDVVALLSTVIAACLLVPTRGPMGAALAALVGAALATLVRAVTLIRVMRQQARADAKEARG